MKKNHFGVLVCILGGFCGLYAAPPQTEDVSAGAADKHRQLRFVQDDAQDYMVSKIYVLKYVQANDIYPFVQGIVKRYNTNSAVSCIEYGSNNEQILTVTCPEGMMPYVDDFVAKVDRDIQVEGKTTGDMIKGTGITRAVYRPRYRSGQILVDIIVNAFINAGPYGSVYAYDSNSNQIYWKDNTSNSEFSSQFLGFLDRPAPQITLEFKIYTMRESMLRDIGLDYLAWKNGPGLNIFQAGFQALSVSSAGSSALQAVSGPLGGFFFAPQFDISFIRLLEQSGKAEVTAEAHLTVSNSDTNTYSISFDPGFQNIIKSTADQSDVVTSAEAGTGQFFCRINQPVVCLHTSDEIDFTIPDYKPGQYTGLDGVLTFGYNAAAVKVLERNNYGSELLEKESFSGNVSIPLHEEFRLAEWHQISKVRQRIGVPFLCEIPVLKYLFSTETVQEENMYSVLTVTATVADTAHASILSGEVFALNMEE